MTINNVTIGDKFKMPSNKYKVFIVVDFHEIKSMITGEVVCYECIAEGVETLAKNRFPVPFATVARGRQ